MSKFQLISDLHLEFCKTIPNIIPKASYLLLAGDIGYPESDIFSYFLKDVSKKFEILFFTPGNHEYYQNFKNGENIKTKDELDIIMKEKCKEYHNIVYLNKKSYELDNINIIGATLWSKVKQSDNLINDYCQIYKYDNKNISISNVLKLHEEDLEFIKGEIKKSFKPNLIMTHHLPSKHLIISEYLARYPKYVSHFSSDLVNLIDPKYISSWVCGHSYAHVDKIINGVNCYINAIGYPSEKYRGSTLDFTFSC